MRWLGMLLIVGSLAACALTFGRELLDGTLDAGATSSVADSVGAAPRRVFASGVVEGSVRDIPLRFEVAGRLQKIHVREGDPIRAGQVLAELESEVWRHRVAEAEARLKLARAERERLINGARRETREVLKADVRAAEVHVSEADALLKRSQQLASRNNVSAQELDDNRFRLEKAQAQLQSARARLAEIEAAARQDEILVADARIAQAEATLNSERTLLEKTQLRAPTDGLVLYMTVESGELVGPADERSLVTVTNRDHTRVRAFVEELDALNVQPGQAARVTVDGRPDKTYKGEILSCAPGVKGKTHRHHRPGELIDVQVREIVIELLDADDLVIGLPVDVFVDPVAPPPADKSTSPAKVPDPLVSLRGGAEAE